MAVVELPLPLPTDRAQLVAADAAQERAWKEALHGDAALRARFVEWVAGELETLRGENPSRALALADCCLELAGRSGDPYQTGLAERGRAWALHHLSRFDQALASYEAAAEAFTRAGDDVQRARTAIGHVWLLRYLGRYDDALALADWARPCLVAGNRARDAATLDMNVASVYRRLGMTRRAVELTQRSAAAFAELGEAANEATALMNAGNGLAELDEVEAALAAYERAGATYERINRPALASTLYTNLGELHHKIGRLDTALRTLTQAVQLAQPAGLEREAAFAHLALSQVYTSLNLVAEALDHQRAALGFFERQGMLWEEASALLQAAELQDRLGHARDAAELGGRAATMFREQGNTPYAGAADVLVAASRAGTGESASAEALRLCRAGCTTLRQAGWRVREGTAHLVEGDLRGARGEAAAAQRAYAAALRIGSSFGNPALAFSASERLGQNIGSHDPETALAHYARAVGYLEESRKTVPGVELRQSFVADKSRLFEEMVRLQLERGAPGATAAAFEAVERSKSRALLDTFASEPSETAAPESSTALARTREQLRWQYNRLDQAQGDPDEMRRRRQQVRKLEAELARQERDMLALGDGPATLRDGQVVALDELIAGLTEDDLLLEYFTAGDEVLCFEIARSGARVARGIASARDVAELAEQHRFMVGMLAQAPVLPPGSLADLEETEGQLLHALYTALLGPLHERWADRRLTVVPHGALHTVPFHALLDGERYVVDRTALTYAPSASVFARLRERPGGGLAGPLLVAPDDPTLPAIQQEVQRLAKLFPDATVLSGADATAVELRRHAPGADILHLATHAAFRSDNPWFSGLKLTDSWLLLREVTTLGLHAWLAVLSACETGEVAVGPGDELVGLSQAFFQAGCRSLVASLWPVNDESAAVLMEAFYQRLQGGADVAESLRQAQLTLREQWPSPYHWAPFVALGGR
ncbi:MAG: hypothetical protein QOF51_2644 [Chloroflexota bacterium]|jgi:CHAT domain-containing protein|nr:hypothetical protein [Chloroflexota bacterium]